MIIDNQKYPYPARLRHHTNPACYIPANELKELPENYPPLIDSINLKNIFINGKEPNVLDVGCGKADFLLNYAEQFPNDNILGIEVRESIAKWAQNIISGEAISNAAVIWYSVINGLNFIPNNSIDKIFYLFPDPWTKRKQIKRRAFIPETLEIYWNLLKQGGKLYLATDVDEVDEYHKKEFNVQEDINDDQWNFPITNKEKFCRREMILFNRIIAEKL